MHLLHRTAHSHLHSGAGQVRARSLRHHSAERPRCPPLPGQHVRSTPPDRSPAPARVPRSGCRHRQQQSPRRQRNPTAAATVAIRRDRRRAAVIGGGGATEGPDDAGWSTRSGRRRAGGSRDFGHPARTATARAARAPRPARVCSGYGVAMKTPL